MVCAHLAALGGAVRGTEQPRDERQEVLRNVIISPPPLPCPEHCEVRFADGVCRLDVTCLFAASSPASSSSSSFLDGGASGAASERSSCRGHCVFEDTEGSCRLDLICLLQRDAAATREFLEQFGVYEEEVVEALALTAEAGSGVKKMQETQRMYEKQVLPPLSPEDKEGAEEDREGTASTSSIVGGPVRPCPGRCEVRNPRRECVVDPVCAAEL